MNEKISTYIQSFINHNAKRIQNIPTPIIIITILGLLVRLGYVIAYPLVWKMAAVFNVFELGLFNYISDFAGYKPSRMPFFDAFSAPFYSIFSPFFSVDSLLLFNVLLSIVAIPAFYLAIEQLWSRKIAIPASLLFALYPKYVTMTSTGLPEAAAISFLAFTMYAFVRARSSGQLQVYFITGIFAMLAYTMFVPAVAVGVLLTGFIYFVDIRARLENNRGLKSLLPSARLMTFASTPATVGVAYLLFGPVSKTLDATSGQNISVFTSPEAYSLIEKMFWYLVYTFFDFWWHTRGFDRERGIRPLIESLQDFTQPLFPVYLLGWTVITLTITAMMIIGLKKIVTRRKELDLLIVCWIITYISVYNFKNLGWVGGFQTRHISPVFIPLCLTFGIGVQLLSQSVKEIDLKTEKYIRTTYIRKISPDTSTIVTGAFFLGLMVLLFNGVGQGVIEQQKAEADTIEPVNEVSDIVDKNETVAVVWTRNLYNLVLYSENQIRPKLLVDSEQSRIQSEGRLRNTAKIEQISDPLLRDANATYLYLHVEPEYVDRFSYSVDLNQTKIDRLINTHTVVYHTQVTENSFRTTSVDVYLLRLNNS